MHMLSLSPATAKAARALLEWQQADLAKAAGLSLTAVNNFERGSSLTRPRTLAAIQAALESHGIEFLPGGLRRTDQISAVTQYEGDDFIAAWNEDIFAALRTPQDDILLSSSDESLWHYPPVQSANKIFLKWCVQKGTKLKTLVSDAEKILDFPKSTYRKLPADVIGKVTYCLYADRLAFVLWKKRQVIVLRNAAVSETFRRQFSHLWRMAKPF